MSGVAKSLGKSFTKSNGGKIAAGLLGAAAVYYLGGLVADNWNGGDTSGDMTGGDSAPDVPDVSTPSAPEVQAPETTDLPTQPTTPPPQAPSPSPTAAEQVKPQVPTPNQDMGPGPTNEGALERKMKWLEGLSPEARALVTGSVQGGTAALLKGVAQQNDQKFSEQREQRFRDDRARRGKVEAMPASAFNKGILNSRMS